MAPIIYKNAESQLRYRKARGAGTEGDPQVAESDVALLPGHGLASETTLAAVLDALSGGGGLTDAQLRAAAVAISVAALPLPAGAATEATLGAVLAALAGVAVTGPLTDAQLRAAAVPVSVASLPPRRRRWGCDDAHLRHPLADHRPHRGMALRRAGAGREKAVSTDIRELLARADAYEAFVLAQIRRGVTPTASEAEAAMHATLAHGDVTGATRAGYRAIVVGPGQSGASEIAEAAAAVEALNPGHSATSHGRLEGDIGVVFTCPTDYQQALETQQAGLKAVLGPTLDAYRDELTARAAKGA